jgi:hypothetical protein
MLFREIIVVYDEHQTKHINAAYGKTHFLNSIVGYKI